MDQDCIKNKNKVINYLKHLQENNFIGKDFEYNKIVISIIDNICK